MGLLKRLKTLENKIDALAKYNNVYFEEQTGFAAKKSDKDPIGFNTNKEN